MNRTVTSVLTLLAASAVCARAELAVSVAPVKDTYQRTQPIEVRVTVTNESSDRSWVLVRRLVLPLEGPQPYPGLSFEVKDESGLVLAASPRPSDKRVIPSLCDFHPLVPGEFFGSRISLTGISGYGYIFPAKGVYRLKAVVVSTAGDWLDRKRGRDGFSAEDLLLLRPRVFQGRVESQEILINVK